MVTSSNGGHTTFYLFDYKCTEWHTLKTGNSKLGTIDQQHQHQKCISPHSARHFLHSTITIKPEDQGIAESSTRNTSEKNINEKLQVGLHGCYHQKHHVIDRVKPFTFNGPDEHSVVLPCQVVNGGG